MFLCFLRKNGDVYFDHLFLEGAPGAEVRKILETMQMKATLRLIEPHLEPMKTSGAGRIWGEVFWTTTKYSSKL